MNQDQKILIENIYKKFQTTMIGSLARFESVFGHLWENEDRKSEEFYDMWEYARNSILNNGNKQARAAIDDLNHYFKNGNQSQVTQKMQFYFDKKKEGDK